MVDRRHRDGEDLAGAGVHAAVGRTTVVRQGDGDVGTAAGTCRRRVAQVAIGRNARSRAEQAGVGVVGHVERQRLAGLIRRTGADGRRPTGHALRTTVFGHALVGALGEARGVVHRVHRDGEDLAGAGVHATVGRTAIIRQGDGNVGAAIGIRRRRVAQVAVGRDGRTRSEQRCVGVAGHVERQVLRVAVTVTDRRGPAGDALCTGVLVHRLVRALGEARGVVDGDRHVHRYDTDRRHHVIAVDAQIGAVITRDQSGSVYRHARSTAGHCSRRTRCWAD